MPQIEFEHTISAGERPQNYTLDRLATGTGNYRLEADKIYFFFACGLNIQRVGVT
jgi:hypothetical protein